MRPSWWHERVRHPERSERSEAGRRDSSLRPAGRPSDVARARWPHRAGRVLGAGPRFPRARVERQAAQYLYSEGDLHYFMNTETYDQFPLNGETLGESLDNLKENATCELLMYGEEAVGVELGAAV